MSRERLRRPGGSLTARQKSAEDVVRAEQHVVSGGLKSLWRSNEERHIRKQG